MSSVLPEGNTWLVIIGSAPYQSLRAEAGVDAVLGCGAFGQSVSLVLKSHGLELLRADRVAPEGQRNLYRQLTSLPLYDVATIHAYADSALLASLLGDEGIEDLTVTAIDALQLRALIASSHHVLSF